MESKHQTQPANIKLTFLVSLDGREKTLVGKKRSITFIRDSMIIDTYKHFSVHYNKIPVAQRNLNNPLECNDVTIVFKSSSSFLKANNLSHEERSIIIKKVLRIGHHIYNEGNLPPHILDLEYEGSMKDIVLNEKGSFQVDVHDKYRVLENPSNTINIIFLDKYKLCADFSAYSRQGEVNVSTLFSVNQPFSDVTPLSRDNVTRLSHAKLTSR